MRGGIGGVPLDSRHDKTVIQCVTFLITKRWRSRNSTFEWKGHVTSLTIPKKGGQKKHKCQVNMFQNFYFSLKYSFWFRNNIVFKYVSIYLFPMTLVLRGIPYPKSRRVKSQPRQLFQIRGQGRETSDAPPAGEVFPSGGLLVRKNHGFHACLVEMSGVSCPEFPLQEFSWVFGGWLNQLSTHEGKKYVQVGSNLPKVSGWKEKIFETTTWFMIGINKLGG